MSTEQYRIGRANLVNGSQTVIGASTDWANEVTPPAVFKVDIDGETTYSISTVLTATRLQLSANYAGSTNSGLAYMINRDFTTNRGYWRPQQGDADLADNLSQETIDLIDTDIADILSGDAGDLITHTNASIDGTLDVGGNSQLDGDLWVKGNASLDGTLAVGGTTSLGGDVDFNGYYSTGQQNIPDLAAKGPAYWFDGVDAKITVADDSNIKGGTGDISIILSGVSFRELGSSADLLSKAAGRTPGDAGYNIVKGSLDVITFYVSGGGGGNDRALITTTATVGAYTNYNFGFVYDRDVDLKIYINGSNADVTLTGDPTAIVNLDNTEDLMIGALSAVFGSVVIARALFFNLALTAAEVKALSSGAPVPFKYIGASQTNEFVGDDSDFDSDTGHWGDYSGGVFNGVVGDWDGGGGTGIGKITFDTGGGYSGVALVSASYFASGANLIRGKRYRINIKAKFLSGSGSVYLYYWGQSPPIVITPSATETTYTSEFTVNETSNSFWIVMSEAAGQVLLIDDIILTQIGCVLQLEQPGIGHGQWIDISGNEGHGDVSGAIPINLPPDHTELYVDLTVTGDISFILPKNHQVKSVTYVSDGAIGSGLDLGTTNGGDEVIASTTIGGAGTFIGDIILSGSIGDTHTTADDILYLTVTDGSGWDGTKVEVRVTMDHI